MVQIKEKMFVRAHMVKEHNFFYIGVASRPIFLNAGLSAVQQVFVKRFK